MRAAIVAAVSDPHQATDNKYSIPSQLADGRTCCAARDWTVATEIVIPGQSRSYDWLHEIVRDLPEYGRLVDLITAEAIDVVVLRDYDRLWRTDALRAQLQVLCEQHRVQIYSLNQPTEVQDPATLRELSEATQLTQILFGWSAQAENALRNRRRRMGMRGRVERGLSPHWGYRPYGYNWVDKDSPIVVNEAEARWVRWLFQERSKGTGYANLAAQMNDRGVPTSQGARWSDIGVKTILRNPIYIGKVVYREYQRTGPRRGGNGRGRRLVAEHIHDGLHEPIISQALWEQVQRINAANRRQYDRPKAPAHIMTGLVKCGFCGASMVHMRRHRDNYYYLRCGTYNRSMGRECQSNQIAVRKVLAFLIDAVEAALADREGFMASYEAAQDSDAARDARRGLEAELADLVARQERLLAGLETGAFPVEVLAQRQAELASRQHAVEAELAALDQADARATAMRASLERYAAFAGHLGEQPGDEIRAVLLNLIRRATITKGSPPVIEWL